MSKKRGKNFLLQGSILAIAGILVRVIGLIYRIPLTNIVGTTGMGIYGTAFQIYDIMLLISSYSLPTAVSRLIARELTYKRYKNSRVIFVSACIFAVTAGGVLAVVTYVGSDLLVGAMNMPSASFALKTLAPTVFIVAFLGVFRGFFQGHGTMIPTALSQVFEQIINAAVSITAAVFLFRSGLALDESLLLEGVNAPAYGAAGGTIGTGAGALAALVFCLIVYYKYRPSLMRKVKRDTDGACYSKSGATKILVLTIVPILLSTTIFQLNSIIAQVVFGAYCGEGYESIWGSFTGQYQLLIHVPTAIAAALGASIIPSITAAVERRKLSEVREKTALGIRFNMLIAIPSTIGLAVLAAPIMNMLFSRTDTALSATMMMIGSTAVLFTSLSTLMNSVLQGAGKIWIPVVNACISEVVHIVFLVLMLYVFEIGIYAVVISNIIFYICMAALNLFCLNRITGYRQEFIRTFAMPVTAAGAMGIICFFLYKLLFSLIGHNTVCALICIIFAVLIYCVGIFITGAINEAELSRLPGGKRIASIAKRMHLLRG